MQTSSKLNEIKSVIFLFSSYSFKMNASRRLFHSCRQPNVKLTKCQKKSLSNDSKDSKDSKDLPDSTLKTNDSVKWPEMPDPNLCCRSGCEKCVWIEYALELERLIQNVDSNFIDDLLKKNVDDESVRSFIKMQLKLKQLEMRQKKASQTSESHLTEQTTESS